MSSIILQTKNLTKEFKETTALDSVNLKVEKGDIYGFIGQNGAGKSTLIRIATGLIRPTTGIVELFGHSRRKERSEALSHVGAIVENPSLYPHMTASQNLEVHRLQKSIPDKQSVHRALSLVGLEDTGGKKAKNFSLGMKQRLGLAIALLGEPTFLILDEPTNGLDPTGIIEFRELLKRLNKENGITILISSHILSELHLLATTYGIIHKGKLLKQFSAKELEGSLRKHLLIKVDHTKKATDVIEQDLDTTDYKIMASGDIKLYNYVDDSKTVSSALTANGIHIEDLTTMNDSLESYYTNLIGGIMSD